MLAIALITGTIALSPSFSKRTFEGMVQETITQSNGEVRLIVQRRTEIYGNPLNALCISKDTKLTGIDGASVSINDIKPGTMVKVTLKDSFVEESPFYYPIVYRIEGIPSGD